MFEAKYAGRCAAECGERIEPGEQVVYVATELVHEACSQSVAAPRGETRYQGTSLDEMGY